MRSIPFRAMRPIAFAVMVVLAGASPTFAVSTSAGVSESYTVAASITVSNVPSTGTFASPPACFPSVGGCLSTDFSYAFTSTIGSNNGTGLTVSVKATTLTSGANVIPLSTRGVVFGNATGFTRNVAATATNIGSLDPTTAFTLGTTAAPGSIALGIEPLLRLDPTLYPAGTYSGTFTVLAATNP